MKEFSVSLDISSASLSLDALTSRLGRTPSGSSHHKGDRAGVRGQFDESIWRLDSEAAATEPLERHMESLAAQLSPQELRRSGLLEEGCEACITIGVFFDTPMASFVIDLRTVTFVKDYGASLDVSCYPCSPGDESS
jgi:hypothetical protein